MTEGSHQCPTITTNIFPFSEHLVVVGFIDYDYASNQDAQIYVSIIDYSFGIILEVTGKDRRSVINNQQ